MNAYSPLDIAAGAGITLLTLAWIALIVVFWRVLDHIVADTFASRRGELERKRIKQERASHVDSDRSQSSAGY